MDVEAERDALVKRQLGLPGGVDVDHFLRLDVALLVINAGLNHAVPNGLQAGGHAVRAPAVSEG